MGEAAYWLFADAADALGDQANVVKALQAIRQLTSGKPASPEKLLLRLGRAALAINDALVAADAFTTVYYDYPLSDEAGWAGTELAKLAPKGTPVGPTATTLPRDLMRAQILYGGKRYTDARAAFAAIQPMVVDSSRFARQLSPRAVRLLSEEIHRRLQRGSRHSDQRPRWPRGRVSALGILREMGRGDEYVTRTRTFVGTVPTDPFAEEALFDLAVYLGRKNDDAGAAAVYAEMYQRFPQGRARRTGGVEGRLVGLQERQFRRVGARVRVGRDYASQIRYASSLALLGGAQPRAAERNRSRAPGLSRRRRRLSQLLLRPRGVQEARHGVSGAREHGPAPELHERPAAGNRAADPRAAQRRPVRRTPSPS